MSTKVDYMALTLGDIRELERANKLIKSAIVARSGLISAYDLQKAEDIIRRIIRRQFWANTE